MGRVFLAKDLRLDRCVAMKVVCTRRRGALRSRGDAPARSEAGGKPQSQGHRGGLRFRLSRQQVVHRFRIRRRRDAATSSFSRRGRLPLDEVLQIVGDLAAALDFAHVQGVDSSRPEAGEHLLHQGWRIQDPRPWASPTTSSATVETGSYSGTPAYSSPEQAECRPTDGKSDQYALGLIVFEMLTGRQGVHRFGPVPRC